MCYARGKRASVRDGSSAVEPCVLPFERVSRGATNA